MARLIKAGAIALACGALLATAAAAPAAGATSSGKDPVVHQAAISKSQQDKVNAYWTKDRMRNAVPFDKLVGRRDISSQVRQVARGKPTIVTPSGLLGPVTPQAFPQRGGAWTGGGAIVKTAGRVFFTMAGRNASCSGDAVVSTNKSVVITAGHCVKYQGAWHTNWVFVPGYNAGSEPYGRWTAKSTLSTPQWVASEDINYDVGAAVVNPLSGRALTDVVGAQAIAFNQARNQAMYAFGYPAAAPYDGSKLIYCSGSTFTDFLLTTDHAMSCNMTGGSSGGPWFLRFTESSGTGAQASVNSFGYTFLPGYMFGPYFGADAQNLYNRAAVG